MNRRVIWTPRAERDLIRHFIYLAEYAGIETARRLRDAAKSTSELLATMPKMGVRREFGRPSLTHVRMWRIPEFDEFLIFYQPSSKGITVLRVVHAKEDYWRVMRRS